MNRPRVLVLFESSGVVRRAMEAAGCDAWSVDLLPSKDASKQHLQCDVTDILAMLYDPNEQRYCWRSGRHDADPWSLVIAHPPCTYLTSSAAWAFGDGPYHQKVKPGTLVGAARRTAREDALTMVRNLFDAPVPRIAIENPVGSIGTAIRKADQYLQPFQFGHDASKRTGLWLKGLPTLRGTNYVPGTWACRCGGRWDQSKGPECAHCHDSAPRLVWANQTHSGQNRLSPSDDRWQHRSETYEGIAAAMAAQWAPLLTEAS